MAQLELAIVGDVPEGLDIEPIRRVFGALVSSEIEVPTGVINLALVDDAKIRELNKTYSGHDYATDVLSFSYIEDGGEPIEGVIGEMAISLETAARQAKAAGTSLADELALLALHGTLHLSGLDHQTPDEQQHIGQLQQQLLTAAGCSYREFTWQD